MVGDVVSYFESWFDYLVLVGLLAEWVVFDLGIGFGKTVVYNFDLFFLIDCLYWVGWLVLIGYFRKRFLLKLFGCFVEEWTVGTIGVVVALFG